MGLILGAFGLMMLLGRVGFGEAKGFNGFAGDGDAIGDCKIGAGLANGVGRIRGVNLLVVAVGVGVGVAELVLEEPPPPPVAQFEVLKDFSKP